MTQLDLLQLRQIDPPSRPAQFAAGMASSVGTESFDFALSRLEGVCKVRVRRVFGLFWPLFDFHSLGGQYTALDIAPQMGIENRLKRTEKSTELHFADTLLSPVLSF